MLTTKALLKNKIKRFCITLYSPAVRSLIKLNPNLKIIGVAGSVGKTSTKFALGEVMSSSGKKVLVTTGAFNDPLAVIFSLMEVEYPNINNPLSLIKAWFKLKAKPKKMVDYDWMVLEMGTDLPGEMRQFGKYLDLELVILTAITPEHMVNFKDFDEVAREELEVLKYSKKVVACRDLVPGEYTEIIESLGKEVFWFGTGPNNDLTVRALGLEGADLNLRRLLELKGGGSKLTLRSKLLHVHAGFLMGGAMLASRVLGVSPTLSLSALEGVEPSNGRGVLLEGKKGSLIIDDSYNNVGANVSIAALDLLYETPARIRIAVLGGINEMSEDNEREAHTQVALHLKSKKLSEVVLIGALAKKYYVPVLENADVKFKWFRTPYEAGECVQTKLKPGVVVLVKGSQNGIYSEEAIPPLLANVEDKKRLVRQSSVWQEKKRKSFEAQS